MALEGFLPVTERGDPPKEEKRSLFRELGLPYVSDPAVTRHLNAFLESAGQAPDAILFNGGFFIPDILRHRVADAVGHWYGKRPEILENRDLDLAVATGAAYYSYVRATGSGVLVRGGLPRTYYIGLAGQTAVCLVPRGAEEGTTLEIDNDALQLVANKPVSFRLYSSLTRSEDHLGDVLELAALGSDLHMHAPLNAVIRFGKQAGERLVPVKLGARLTELGTLETWCESKISENRWRLQFELRKAAAETTARRPAAVIGEQALAEALELVPAVFSATAKSPILPEELPARLEQILGLGKNSWPLSAIRQLADAFLGSADGRKKSPAYEARWLNLCGFCLRPGFGYPGDDWRIDQARRLYGSGLQYANQVQGERLTGGYFGGASLGGLNRNQHGDIYQRLSGFLLPRGGKQQRVNNSLLREMWRAAASLELLPAGTRTELGEALVRKVKAGDFRESELWCLSRLGGPGIVLRTDQSGPGAGGRLSRWAEALLAIDSPGAADALASIARRTEDPTRDLPSATLAAVRRRLENPPRTAGRYLAILDGAEERDESARSGAFSARNFLPAWSPGGRPAGGQLGAAHAWNQDTDPDQP